MSLGLCGSGETEGLLLSQQKEDVSAGGDGRG